VAKGTRAWPGHHIGDLRNEETLRSFTEGIAHFERLFAVAPALVAYDLHPDYLSTAYALARDGVTHVGVQHHHAHLAAVLAEHGERGAAIGAIYDGTGYGPDATVWGGELLAGGLHGCERVGHLWPVRMPGGDRAVRQPWRMACSWLAEAHGAEPAPLPGIEPRTWHAVAELARIGLAAPLTTSMGRLFDAVAALCGLRNEVTYEGQAAVELEAVSDRSERGAYPLDVAAGILDARVTVAAVARDVAAGVHQSVVGARFHRAIARATAQACGEAADARGLDTVVLSGGVWQNRLLLDFVTPLLEHAGLRVLVPERLPPNDGAISFGQAAVAAARAHGEASV
jgi:hydrogenase maturation protein HypF